MRPPAPSAAGSWREPAPVFSPGAPPTARIAAVLSTLQPAERRVAERIVEASDAVVEWTAQELADRSGVGLATVVRTCQTVGYRGYPQLRVALAAELGGAPESA